MATVTFQNKDDVFQWEIKRDIDPESFQSDYVGTLEQIAPWIENHRLTKIVDLEGFGGWKLTDFFGMNSKPEALALFARIGNLIHEHSEAFAFFCSDHIGVSPNEADAWEKEFERQYQGEYRDAEEWALEHLEQGWTLPENNPYAKHDVGLFLRDTMPYCVNTGRRTVYVFERY